MIIGGYHPLTLSDYPGTPAAVLFLQGCNWRCSYCHNRRLLPLQPPRPPLSFSSIFRQLQQRAGKIEGVVFSGGEPTLHTDLDRYMLPVKELGLKIKLDTNGTDPAAVRRLLNAGLLDYIAMDIKAAEDDRPRPIKKNTPSHPILRPLPAATLTIYLKPSLKYNKLESGQWERETAEELTPSTSPLSLLGAFPEKGKRCRSVAVPPL